MSPLDTIQVMTTGFYTHRDCHRHQMGDGHPECPERLDAINDSLITSRLGDFLARLDAPLASPNDIELAHSRMHLASLQGLSVRLNEEITAGGSTHLQIDPDTSINAYSYQAALRAAGAAIAATDAVIAGNLANAFCSVRPPGHHATHNKAMGFCFFNNVAIAVKYALERHGLKRVAVVDFDVHHGNGTEDILAGDERALMVGIFQDQLYPFSGNICTGANILNVPVPAYTRGPAVRDLFTDVLLPRLDDFRPEMIFISAGFDAHREDELGQLGLVENDYAWMTEQIMHIAKRHAKGRIVSCLEGGYALGALGRSVEAHIRVLADA